MWALNWFIGYIFIWHWLSDSYWQFRVMAVQSDSREGIKFFVQNLR